MSSKLWIAGSAIAGVVIVGALALSKAPSPAPTVATQGMSGQPAPAQFPQVTPPEQQDDNMGLLARRPMGQQPSALEGMVPVSFKATKDGRLHIDAEARTEMERVTAVYSREEAPAKLAEAIGKLPVAAQREARDLYEQYTQYNQALSQAIPLEQKDISTLQQAREQFDSIKKLRAQFFGANAEAMFQNEEAMTQRILDHAAEYLKSHPNASLQEAAGYGQEKVLSGPEDLKP